MNLKQTFLSLRNRNFRLFFIGQSISNTGNWLTNVALTLLVLNITHSGFDVGILAACQFGPVFFLTAWAGSFADHVDKRKALLFTQSAEMAQSIGLAAVAALPHPPLASLYGLAVIGGVLLSYDNPLRRSFVTEMVPTEDISNAVVLYSTIVNIARLLGPALAGLITITLGYSWAFAIDAATYVVILSCLVSMRPSELYRRIRESGHRGTVVEGLRYIGSMPVLWISFVMLTCIGVLSYNFNVTLPLFVTDSLRKPGSVFTILYSIFSLGAIVSSLVIASRNLVRLRHIIAGAAALGLTMLVFSGVASTWEAIPAIFLVGAASVLYLTATTAIIQIEAKPSMHGRVLALQSVMLFGSSFIGGPILGRLADSFGGRVPVILGGIVCLLSAAFGLLAARWVRSNYAT